MDERTARRESGAARSRIKGSTLSSSIQKATSNGKARLMALHRGARQQATLAARSEARLIGRRVRIPCNNDATRCAENCASCRFGVIVSAVNGQCLVDLTSPTSRAAAPAAEISSFNVMKWAAMAHSCTSESEVLMTQLNRGVDEMAMATDVSDGAAGGHATASSSSTDVVQTGAQQDWHPTFRVRKWLLPDVDGLSDALAGLGSAVSVSDVAQAPSMAPSTTCPGMESGMESG